MILAKRNKDGIMQTSYKSWPRFWSRRAKKTSLQIRLLYVMAKILADKRKEHINAKQVIIRYGQDSGSEKQSGNKCKSGYYTLWSTFWSKKAKRAPQGNYTPLQRDWPIRGKRTSQQPGYYTTCLYPGWKEQRWYTCKAGTFIY